MEKDLKLYELPEIKELLQVLEENGLHQEQANVRSLVDYIQGMETKLNDMTREMQAMHGEVNEIRDNTIRAKCTELLAKADEKIQQAKKLVVSCKENLITSARNALKAFKEKGKDALITAVNAMKIPSALEMLRNGFQRVSEAMHRDAGKLDAVREELHGVGLHLKNAGRALIGKPTKESEQLEADKGVLARLRNFLQRSGDRFADMGRGAEELATGMRESHEQRQSVKAGLNQLKAEQKKAKAPKVQEPVR